MKIKDAILEGKLLLEKNNIDDSRIIVKTLIRYVLKKNETFIIVNGDCELEEEHKKTFFNKIDKIIKGIPIQYITNNQEFMKLDFYVDENVLIPQPDTEILVEEVIKKYKEKYVDILDLCTGSGAIGISLAKYIKNSKITCSDISNKAIQIAKLNAEKNLCHKKIDFIISDMFEKLENKKYDIIVSNPPYIEKDVIKTLSLQVQNEPIIALDGGVDGLDFYKIIANYGHKFLKSGGELYLEIGSDQKESVTKILEQVNIYKNIKCIKDLANNDRVITCKI